MNMAMRLVRRVAGNPYVEPVLSVLLQGASWVGRVVRRLSFPGDSLALLAFLLAANLLRVYLPGLVSDGIFVVTVLFLGLSLFRERLPGAALTTLLCFVALLAVYGVGLLVEFSIQGASNFFGILFAGIIFLFCWCNAPTLIRSRYTIPLLLAVALGLFPLYLLSSGLNPHSFSALLSGLLLIVGIIVIARARSDRVKDQHLWAHLFFLLAMAVSVAFGNRSLVLAMLLAYPLYWGGRFFLRNHLRTGALATIVGVLIVLPIILLGTPFVDVLEKTFGHVVSQSTGGRIKSGRETLWRYSLDAISEAPWFGRGPGVVISTLTDSDSSSSDSSSSEKAINADFSCLGSLNPGLRRDCDALLEVRNALTREAPSASDNPLWSWVPPNYFRSWRGVKLAGEPPRVVSLSLQQLRLRGVIPPALGRLDRLEELWLSENLLSGPIPSELGKLTNLRVLAVADNALSGPVPPELGRLENLEELWLRGNRLSGEVPPELANLSKLSLLRLAGNDFSGTFPPALYEVTDHDFHLTVTCLPSSLVNEGLLSDCETLLAARDTLAGDAALLDWERTRPIAQWQGVKLGEAPPRVVAVDLRESSLGGVISPELGRLDRLEVLEMSVNALTGSIPPELGGLTNLRVLGLADNALSGSIPPELGRLENLEKLWLRGNRLSGEVPPELGWLLRLSLLRLAWNNLAGSLPPALDHVVNHDFTSELYCVPSSYIDAGLLADCTALLEMRDKLTGDVALLEAQDIPVGELSSWKESIPIEKWRGVQVGAASLRVVALRLQGLDLQGKIPPALGRLDRLEELQLSENALSGPIPSELGELTNLRVLALDDNALSGLVPPELGSLENLEELWLSGNRLSGEVPPELAELSKLSLLRLAGNNLVGLLPSALHDVMDTDLDDSLYCVPSPYIDEGLLADCTLLLEAQSMLAGDAALDWHRFMPIMQWQGVKLHRARVARLDLTGVGLSGSIPPALGNLSQLVSLRLADNVLTGPIPPELGRLEHLEELLLRGNRLSGEVPLELAELSNLSVLRLAGNDMAAPLPPALRKVRGHDLDRDLRCPAAPRSNTGLINDCAVLLEVRDTLAGDISLDWTGRVPIDFWPGVTVAGTPARVTELNLPDSGLNGVIPPALSELDRLVKLNLEENALTGPIPPELAGLVHLQELVLRGNDLSGAIPPQLGGLEQLTTLHLYQNRLSGAIPPELGDLRSLLGLSLASNRLSGSIPEELGRLKSLKWLNFRFNRLTGRVPPALRRLSELESVSLADNDLSDAPRQGATTAEASLGLAPDRAPATVLLQPSNPDLLADRALLLKAQDTLAGTASLNWDDSVPLYFWEGVVLGGTPARVTALNLPEKGLDGTIPPELGGMGKLTTLRLHRNRLSGPIPSELGRLTELRELALGGNALSGAIPRELGDLEGLTMLHLRRNQLTGAVPVELAGLKKLQTLALDYNSLRGLVPRELAQLPALEELLLAGNQVDMPPELADFHQPPAPDPRESSALAPVAKPAGVDLFCPDMGAGSGGLAGDCAALLAARDALAGDGTLNWGRGTPIGAWQGVSIGGELPRVFALKLSGAGLTGVVPPDLGRLEKLVWLDLDDNALTGSIPPELAGLAKLRRLELGGNDLSGPVPPELVNLSSLEELLLAGNRLTGSIPPELATLDKLSILRLGGNEFTGCIPQELQSKTDRELRLDLLCDPSSQSGRDLREDTMILMDVRDVLAGGARLNWSYTSPVSSWQGVTLGSVRPDRAAMGREDPPRETSRVVGLDLSGMGLSGQLPPTLGNLDKLIWLRLNDNRLSGPIPPELGQLADLRELGLDSNILTGAVPPELGQLVNLSELWLGHNRLSDSIPPELAALDGLRVLHLRGNAFTGCLPPLGWAATQFRARPEGLRNCGAAVPEATEFASLGDAIRRLNVVVDPSAPGNIPSSAHNLYLQVGLQTGVFGLGVLFLLCASLIFNLRAKPGMEVTWLHCYAAVCTITILVVNTFDVYLLQNVFAVACVQWILIGLGAGAVNHLFLCPAKGARSS